MQSIGVIVTILLFGKYANGYVNMPSYVPVCDEPTSDEEAIEFAQCFIEKAHASRGYMRTKGIPEVKIPALNKVVLPKVAIEQKTRSFDYKMIFTNVSVFGLDEYVLHDAVYHWKNLSFDGIFHFDKLTLNGNYQIQGRIFDQLFDRSGPLDVQMIDAELWFQYAYSVYMKNGIKRCNFLYMYTKMLKVGNMIGELHNLFGTNNVLNKAANELLSSRQILENVTPEVEKVIRKIVSHIAKAMLNSVPYHQLLGSRH